MKFEIVSASELSFTDQAAAFNDAFTGYVGGSFHLDASSLTVFICAQGIDLCYSRFARSQSGELVGFGYINRTAGVTRLAGMGTITSARRSGVAAFLLSELLNEANQRGDEIMMLEVIEQNPAAVALYHAHGFVQVTRLLGWRGSHAGLTTDVGLLNEISILDATRLATPLDYPTLPWPISRHAAAKIASPRAFALGNVAVIISDLASSPTRLYSFPGFDGSSWDTLRTLTGAVLAKFPDREFYAAPVFPEEFGTEVFEPMKFRREPINQFLMRKDLSA